MQIDEKHKYVKIFTYLWMIFEVVAIGIVWDDSKLELDGIVTQLLYKDDEQNWCNACVVENKKLQKAYLIPFPGKMPEYKIFGQLVHCGKFISKKGRAYPRIQKIDMEVKR